MMAVMTIPSLNYLGDESLAVSGLHFEPQHTLCFIKNSIFMAQSYLDDLS